MGTGPRSLHSYHVPDATGLGTTHFENQMVLKHPLSSAGLAKKFIRVFLYPHMEKLEQTLWPTQYFYVSIVSLRIELA